MYRRHPGDHFRILSLVLICAICTVFLANPRLAFATTETRTFTTTGPGTWVAPPGVTSVAAEVWAGGGGGGGSAASGNGGGGGAGGGYAKKNAFTVTPGNTYNFYVARGGTGGTGTANGTNGDDSMFNASSTVLAVGGPGGASLANGSAGGATTTGSTAVGDTIFHGGNGGSGTGTSGGGGGGAGDAANGAKGTNGGAGGAGGSSGGGTGGAGVSNNATANAGSNFGGGGSGVDSTNTTPKTGGNGAQGQLKLTYTTYTILADATDPSNSTIAPGASATVAGAFTFQTSTSTDVVSDVTVNLGTSVSSGISLVEITNSAGSTVYGSVSNPASDSPVVTLNTNTLTANTTATTYKIRITPKSHANMPAVPGAAYAVTAKISAWTSTNTQSGSDTAGATITIDNASPANVTSSTASAGVGLVSLAWTNPGDSDFSEVVILRSTSAVSDVPVEGTSYATSTAIGSSVVACVGRMVSCDDTGLSVGTAYHYKIFSKDTSINYSAGTVPTGSPATPSGPPTVTTSAASSVTASGATLNGNITATNGSSPTVRGFASSTDSSLITGVSTSTESGSFGTGAFTGSMGGLTGNTTYYFRAYATNSAGTGYGSIQNFLTLPAAPGSPTYSSTQATTTGISWSAPSGGATSYKLSQCRSGPVCTLITGITVTSTTTYSLIGNTTYDYAVLGTNATGDGAFSATSSRLTVPDVPGTPSFSSITETTVHVSWSAPTGGASAYRLERCTGSGCTNFVQQVDQAGASYDDSALSPATTYVYRVRATNNGGSGVGLYSASAEVTTTDTTPPAPDPASFSSTPAAASASSISMTATTETDAATPPVEYYFGYSACVSNGGTGGVDSGWQSGTSYTNSSLQPNQCYGYKVKARDSASPPNGTATSSASTIYTFANTPGSPTLSSPTASTLTLTNAQNSNPAANPTTKFAASVTSTSPSDATWQDKYIDASGNPTATETWLTDAQLDNLVLNGLAGGTSYTVKVAARNEDLIKTASSTGGTGTTVTSAPGTPSYSNTIATSTTISWSAATGATTYNLTRCVAGPTCASFTGIAATSYDDSGTLSGNTSYDYAVQGVNGSGPGTWSATSTVLTRPDVPGAPSFSSITQTTVHVSWSAPTGGASDYKLARCEGSGCTNFSPFPGTTGGASLDDSGLSANTIYRYIVLGTNATGDGYYSSASDLTTLETPPSSSARFIRLKVGTRLRGGIRLR